MDDAEDARKVTKSAARRARNARYYQKRKLRRYVIQTTISLICSHSLLTYSQQETEGAEDITTPQDPGDTGPTDRRTAWFEFARRDAAALSHEEAVALPYYM